MTYIPFLFLAALLMLKRAVLLSACLFALAWSHGFCQLLLNVDTDKSLSPIHLRGEIISLVDTNSDWLSVDIQLIKRKLILSPSQKIRVSWHGIEDVEVGQVYDFVLKPKSISGVMNQGGFNQQKYLLSQHIIGKGTVVSAQLVDSSLGFRESLRQKLAPVLLTLPHGDLLLALVLGDRTALDDSRWQALRQTGTGHLVAISGLHLSVICAWAYGLSLWGLKRLPAQFGRRNTLLAVVSSLLAVLIYAYLAGFAIATQRAFIMISVLLLMTILRRFSSPWERLLTALFVVLVIDPLASLSAGFWLSFMAIALILTTINLSGSLPAGSTLWQRFWYWCGQFWQIQWRLSLGLGLLGSLFFGGISLLSLWINLLVVPWFSLVVIPLSFVGLLLWWLSELVNMPMTLGLELANLSLIPFSVLIDTVSQWRGSWLPLSDTLILQLGFLCAGGAILWLGWRIAKPKTGLFFGSLLVLPMLVMMAFRASDIAPEQWQVHLLDVGQGLAVVIEKSDRAIIYDTGAAFGEHFSYAQRVIIPFIQSRGIDKVDYLIVSHSDNDHAGGVQPLLTAFTSVTLISDVPFLPNQQDCRPKELQWQGLSLRFLAPAVAVKGNNGSCVLTISDEQHSVLLSGDIELAAEADLVARQGLNLESQVLIAPHHGSRTSSTTHFIDAVNPKLVLVPAGWENRYGFPKSDVMSRYHMREIPTLVSGENGQISVLFQPQGVSFKTYRTDLAPFWYNALFRFGEFVNPE